MIDKVDITFKLRYDWSSKIIKVTWYSKWYARGSSKAAYVDATSSFHLDDNGKVFKHVVDRDAIVRLRVVGRRSGRSCSDVGVRRRVRGASAEEEGAAEGEKTEAEITAGAMRGHVGLRFADGMLRLRHVQDVLPRRARDSSLPRAGARPRAHSRTRRARASGHAWRRARRRASVLTPFV